MRAYRRRQRESGLVTKSVTTLDPVAASVRFSKDTLLTPAEQDVVRRFCGGLRRLPELPLHVAIFGSRAKGGSGVNSDLDVAVVMESHQSAQVSRTLAALAYKAAAPYQEDGGGIHLKPVPIFIEDRHKGFFTAIRRHLDTVWTRPR